MIPKHRANTGGVGCVVDYPHIETGQQGHTKREVKLVNNLRRPNQQQHCAAFGYYTLQCTRLLGGLATSSTASCDLSCHNTIVCRPAEGGGGVGAPHSRLGGACSTQQRFTAIWGPRRD